MIHTDSPSHWKDYELIDCGDFEKLERFGDYILIRPEPQAVWHKVLTNEEWLKRAHIKFKGRSATTGEWEMLKKAPDRWNINYKTKELNLNFRMGLTSFKHVGIFPEQAANWDYIAQSVKKLNVPEPKVLNLFAYTGGASLAARAAGATVSHVDSIKQVVTWANENQQLSNLDNIQWVVEDALKFVKREVKRGKQYHGIMLDPPAFGHGPNGEKWKLEDSIQEMMMDIGQLLHPEKHFLLLNAYSLGFSSLIIQNLLLSANIKSTLTYGELCLKATSGVTLPLGVYGRAEKM